MASLLGWARGTLQTDRPDTLGLTEAFCGSVRDRFRNGVVNPEHRRAYLRAHIPGGAGSGGRGITFHLHHTE